MPDRQSVGVPNADSSSADRARQRLSSSVAISFSARLFDRNVDDIYRFCLARSRDPEMAADATSEAFLAAARLASHGRGVEVDRDVGGDLGDEVPCVSAAEVVETLGSLPDRQRAALALRYLDECSVSEVADALAIGYQAAESLLARGRRSFERAWAARGLQPEAKRGGRPT